MVPQLLPKDAQVFGVQLEQVLVLHIWPIGQPPLWLPHVIQSSQPSSIMPQFELPQVLGVQALQTPPVQACPVGQLPLLLPQLSWPPQPSSQMPQVRLPQVLGVQLLQTPPAQTCPVAQLFPQLSVPPQPSEMAPHCAPAAAQVIGAQVTHLLFVQVLPAGQPVLELRMLHSCVRPSTQASRICPHSAAAALQPSNAANVV